MSIVTSAQLPPAVQVQFNYKLLSVPVPAYIHRIPAMRIEMDANSGNTVRSRRYNPLVSSLVPLGNSGITPPSTSLSAIDIDAKISYYGQYIYINEQVVLNNQDPKWYGVFKFLLIDLEPVVALS